MSLDLFRRQAGVLAFIALSIAVLFLSQGSVRAQSTPFRHVWAGNVFDGWTSADGSISAVAEDGGRIRFRNANNVWSFESVPDDVKDHLLRIHFLETAPNHPVGWAVGLNGWFLESSGLGTPWTGFQFPPPAPEAPREELWDVDFIDTANGWVVSLHNVYATTSGGHTANDWDAVTLRGKDGMVLTAQERARIQFYAIDVEAVSSLPNPPPN